MPAGLFPHANDARETGRRRYHRCLCPQGPLRNGDPPGALVTDDDVGQGWFITFRPRKEVIKIVLGRVRARHLPQTSHHLGYLGIDR